MIEAEIISQCTGFDWDNGNLLKNWEKHNVSFKECEQLFFNTPLLFGVDEKHSKNEKRFFALGRTDSARLLFIVFTIRGKLIRVISARDMNRKEKKVYTKA